MSMIKPLTSKADQERFMNVAEVAAKFVAKYLYELRANGVRDEVLPTIAVSLSHSVISHLLADIPTSDKVTDRAGLEEWDTSGQIPQ